VEQSGKEPASGQDSVLSVPPCPGYSGHSPSGKGTAWRPSFRSRLQPLTSRLPHHIFFSSHWERVADMVVVVVVAPVAVMVVDGNHGGANPELELNRRS